jgi:hypothetical protein
MTHGWEHLIGEEDGKAGLFQSPGSRTGTSWPGSGGSMISGGMSGAGGWCGVGGSGTLSGSGSGMWAHAGAQSVVDRSPQRMASRRDRRAGKAAAPWDQRTRRQSKGCMATPGK